MVSNTLQKLAEEVYKTLRFDAYIVSSMPNTFTIGDSYIISPERVDVEYYMNNGSFQDFDVNVVIPIKQIDSGHLEVLDRSIIESYENITNVLSKTLKRPKKIGNSIVNGSSYQMNQWEVNGYIYATADITISFTSFLDV